MGNCLATDDNSKQNASVNRDIKKAKQNLDREIKVLLLGAGESGKFVFKSIFVVEGKLNPVFYRSTIFKQMKIIHQSGFSKEECLLFREVVQGNVLKAMKALVAASLNLSIPIESPENRVCSFFCFFTNGIQLILFRNVLNTLTGSIMKCCSTLEKYGILN